MTNDQPVSASPKLGLFDISCVVVGGIIGVGIFFAPSKVAKVVASPTQVIAAWALGGAIALLGAWVFAHLSRMLPGHGGTFVYIHRAFGKLPSFLFGWCNWLVIQTGAAAVVALVLVDYLQAALGLEQPDEKWGNGVCVLLSCGILIALTLVNVLGLRFGRSVQNTLTVIKVVAVFSLVLLPWFVPADSTRLEDVPKETADVGWLVAMSAAILPILFSFGGWQQGSFLAGAARRPDRDVPLGILAGVVVVVLAYLTVNLAILDLLGFAATASSKTIATDAVRKALEPHGYGDAAAQVFGVAVVISALGILNTICMAPPYVLHEMSRKGLFLKQVGVLHARFGTPVIATVVQGAWAVILLLGAYLYVEALDSQEKAVDLLDWLVQGVIFADWIFFAGCGFALASLGSSVVTKIGGALFGATSVAVAVAAFLTRKEPSLYGLGILVIGIVVFQLVFVDRKKD